MKIFGAFKMRLVDLVRTREDGFSIVEGLIAAAIMLFAIIAILRMITAGSNDVLANKVRSIAQSEAVYGAEKVRSQSYDDLAAVPGHTYVSEDVARDGITYTRVIHYLVTDTNNDTVVDELDYVIATVTVGWDKPEPVKPVEMTVYKTP